jgi:hypothetical protein
MNNIRKQLLKLADEVVDDLMQASDEEIRSEAIEDGLDIEKEVSKVRGILEQSRFRTAQDDLKKEHTKTVVKGNVIDIDEARIRIRRACEKNKDLLMAARFGEELPDEDVMDTYRQMVKHGIIQEDLNDDD